MYTQWSFWRDAAERAGKTAAQAALGLLAADPVLGLLDVDWGQGASVVGLAALVSLLTSVASAKIGTKGTASLVPDPELPHMTSEELMDLAEKVAEREKGQHRA